MSNTSTMRASTATRSPGCAKRCETMPVKGERKTVSLTALAATSTLDKAARCEACAAVKLATDVSSAVLEIKPCSTSALLLSNWRCAMAICALAESA